jgi:hypothetical protein
MKSLTLKTTSKTIASPCAQLQRSQLSRFCSSSQEFSLKRGPRPLQREFLIIGGGAIVGGIDPVQSAFFAKYDPSGNLLWQHSFNTQGIQIGINSLSVDSNGNAFIAGSSNSQAFMALSPNPVKNG